MFNNVMDKTDSRDEYLNKATIGERKIHNAKIELVEYDHNWPVLFERGSEENKKYTGQQGQAGTACGFHFSAATVCKTNYRHPVTCERFFQ